MKNMKVMLFLMLSMSLILGGVISVSAKYSDAMVEINIPIYQEKKYIDAERSASYSYVYLKNYEVRPTSDSQTDNFQYIWGGTADRNKKQISAEEHLLKEGDPATKVTMKEGKMNVVNVCHYFYGNSKNNPAIAIIGYSSWH